MAACAARTADRSGAPGQVAAVRWTPRRLAESTLNDRRSAASAASGTPTPRRSRSPPPVCTHSAAQGTGFAEFPVLCHPPCTSAYCVADVIGGRRRMELRPYGIGENGEYLEVADRPRPSAGAKQSARQSLLHHVWRCPGHAPNGPSALDRPWVPVRRLIPVSSSPRCLDWLGSRHVGSQPTTSNQRTGESHGEHPSQRLVRQ
jgi:hypothetical protein